MIARDLFLDIRRSGSALALTFLVGCTGHSAGLSSSDQEATVSGTIRAGDRPVTQGQVTFDPSSSVRKSASSRTAQIAKDGTYSVSTLIGQNRIRFSDISAQRNLSFEEVVYQVGSGSTTFDIDLKPTQPRRGR